MGMRVFGQGADNHGNDFGTASPITVGSTVSAGIDYAGDLDYFTFSPSTSGVYLVKTTGSTDTVIELYDSARNSLQYNDDFTDTNATLCQYLEAGNSYYARLSHYSQSQTGAFDFAVTLQSDDVASVRRIDADNTLNFNIGYAEDVDVFEVIPYLTGEYIIQTTGTTDTLIYLYDEYGNELDYNDDDVNFETEVTDINSKIVYSLIAGKKYYVNVRCFDNTATGTYGLSVSRQMNVSTASNEDDNDIASFTVNGEYQAMVVGAIAKKLIEFILKRLGPVIKDRVWPIIASKVDDIIKACQNIKIKGPGKGERVFAIYNNNIEVFRLDATLCKKYDGYYLRVHYHCQPDMSTHHDIGEFYLGKNKPGGWW